MARVIRRFLSWTGEQLRPAQSAQLLRAHLKQDAPLRERTAARGLAVIFACGLPWVLFVGPFEGWQLTIALSLALGLVLVYSLALLEALKRGWFRPFVPWMNSLVEVSLPLPFIAIEIALRGGSYALTAPVTSVWTGLVAFSALRADPRICLVGGAVAAAELLGVYAWVRHGGAVLLPTLTTPWMLVRALYLLFSGVGGAIIASTLVRKAEEALSAVREQDLMGRYFLHEKIGTGGMAEVYRATYSPEGGFQKTVAIKRVLPGFAKRPHFRELFLDEARLCALLNHPNVVQVFDCGRYQDTYILAMEYVDGMSVQSLLAALEEPLPLAAVTYLGVELGAALEYLHNRIGPDGRPLALVHRDVNPPNVLISRFGEVKLTDFGVAHAATLTTPQAVDQFVGKSLYAAPEQRRCESLDRRADLFALGLTLYEALTRRTIAWERLPEGGKADFTLRIPPPSRFRLDVPPELDAIVMRLLEFDPALRFQSGAGLRDALTALRGPIAPFPEGQAQLTRTATRAIRARFNEGEVTDPEAMRLPLELTGTLSTDPADVE